MRNYNLEMEKFLESTEPGTRLLLHSCCGPCSTAVLERLGEVFEIILYFYNPNIDSKEEFKRRLWEQHKVLGEIHTAHPIRLVAGEYIPHRYEKAVEGLERLGEGSARCSACFRERLEEAARMAKVQQAAYFTTTLSISPHKNAHVLMEIGEEIARREGLLYLPSDFKKKNGMKRSIELSRKMKLYRQDYCGCRFSREEAEKRRRARVEKEKMSQEESFS